MARRRRRSRDSDGLLTLGVIALALVVGAFLSSLVLRWTGGTSSLAGDGARDAAPRPAPAADTVSGSGAEPDVRASGVDRARIRVEVLNAARVPGLADRVTRLLRSRGFDVVDYGNDSRQRPISVILDRVDNPVFARELALALPGTPIRRDPSPDRFIDVTLVVGSDYARLLEESREERGPAGASSRAGPLAWLRDRLGL